jgi:hypothetical protein
MHNRMQITINFGLIHTIYVTGSLLRKRVTDGSRLIPPHHLTTTHSMETQNLPFSKLMDIKKIKTYLSICPVFN